jgi:hypothetical protein
MMRFQVISTLPPRGGKGRDVGAPAALNGNALDAPPLAFTRTTPRTHPLPTPFPLEGEGRYLGAHA